MKGKSRTGMRSGPLWFWLLTLKLRCGFPTALAIQAPDTF
jgi:hypothetical protein